MSFNSLEETVTRLGVRIDNLQETTEGAAADILGELDEAFDWSDEASRKIIALEFMVKYLFEKLNYGILTKDYSEFMKRELTRLS